MPDVASPQVTVPTDGVRSLRRPATPRPESDQAADADFGKQLADMATGDERPGRSVGAKDGREPPVSGWRQWGAKFVPLDGDQGAVPETAVAETVSTGEEGNELKAALPVADPAVVDDGLAVAMASTNALPPDTTAVPAGPLPPPTVSVGPALVVPTAAPVDAAEASRPPQAMRIDPSARSSSATLDGAGPVCPTAPRAAGNVAGPVPPVAQDAAADVTGFAQRNPTGAVQGVSVVRSETHWHHHAAGSSSAGNRAVAADATPGCPASADAAGAPAEEAKPRPHPVVAARSKDGGQWPGRDRQVGAPAPQVVASASPGGRRAPAAGRACRGPCPQCTAGQPGRRSIRRSQPGAAAASSAAVLAGAADRRQDRGRHCTHKRA
jgi:hypothetical protein